MTRNVRVAAAAMITLGGLMAVGCSSSRTNLQERFQSVNNNNSWPERYSYSAREPVLYSFEAQANNAAAVDGVINNAFFEAGSDKLNGVGTTKLDALARVMPNANPTVYLQTAGDVAYDSANPTKSAQARTDLDQKRAQAILSYLSARPNTRGTAFEVSVIDIADPSINSTGPATAIRGLASQYRSGITGSLGGTLSGTGGGQASSTVGVAAGANTGSGSGSGSGSTGGNTGGTQR
jgi:hypothetical protein